MKILVINCGSSSLKYQVIDMDNEQLLAKGVVEKIGMEDSTLTHQKSGMEKEKVLIPMKNHTDAFGEVIKAIKDPVKGAIKSIDEIDAVGHRVVHAGEKYACSVLINDSVVKALEECIELAPLHNPPNLLGIAACKELMPNTPMVGVFDTAFHQTMDPEAFLYPLPYEFYEKYGVRKYGFHGTSHKYVAYRAAEMLGKDIKDLKLITCHLGNGASIAAVDHGRCVDTSMGFTPLEGLMMGTRCGNIDPTIVTFLMNKENLTIDQVNDIMNKKSGVLGISGVSSDFRDIGDAVDAGNERALLARRMFARRVKFYIGAYMAEMNGADAIIFTAGVGEHRMEVRELILKDMENLGVIFDPSVNQVRAVERVLSKPESKVKVLLIPTEEELMIARETKEIIENL